MMTDEMLEYRLLEREGGLMASAHEVADRCANKDAGRHMREGFYRRVLFCRENRFQANEIMKSAGQAPLGAYRTTDLNIHLNSFYIHLRGALDNLAWALNYELSLLPEVHEDKRGRQECHLFGKKFLCALGGLFPTAAKEVASKGAWERDLKTRRDPVAHRIPLFAFPAVADDQQATTIRDLHARAQGEFLAKDFHRGMELLREAGRIGTYRPWFAQSTAGGLRIRDIGEQMTDDSQNFLDVCEPLLHALLPRLKQESDL